MSNNQSIMIGDNSGAKADGLYKIDTVVNDTRINLATNYVSASLLDGTVYYSNNNVI